MSNQFTRCLAGQPRSSSTHGIKYSVIVPAYNAQTSLPQCLDSLSRQTVARNQYEIIVVDDGSTDETSKAASRFDVHCLYQSNRGPAAARNHGAETAHGQIVLFTDSDCIPALDWLEQMVIPFQDPDVVAVKGAYTTTQRELVARFAQMEFEDRYDLLRKNPFIDMVDTYSAAFRKDVFLSTGRFDSNFPKANNEDTELSYRLSTAGHKMLFNPNATVEHRHPNSLGKYLRTKFWRAYWRMIVYRRFPRKAIKDSYTPLVLKLQTALMAASLPLMVAAFASPSTLWIVLILWAGILASTVPFSVKTFRRDGLVGMVAPGIVFLRAAVFALGSASGMVGSFYFPHPGRSQESQPPAQQQHSMKTKQNGSS